jgi:hypothetical protein
MRSPSRLPIGRKEAEMAYNPIPTFLQEAEELIADIEQSALGLAAEADQAETVNRLSRTTWKACSTGREPARSRCLRNWPR